MQLTAYNGVNKRRSEWIFSGKREDYMAYIRNGGMHYFVCPDGKNSGLYTFDVGDYHRGANVAWPLGPQATTFPGAAPAAPKNQRPGYTLRTGGSSATPFDMIFPQGRWLKAGTERIRGVMTDKYWLTFIKGQHEGIEGLYWINQQTGVPECFTLMDPHYNTRPWPFTFDLVSFEQKPQSESLFTVPRHYKRLQINSGQKPALPPKKPARSIQ